MCGIVCAFDIKQKVEDLRPQVLEMAKKKNSDMKGRIYWKTAKFIKSK